MAVSAATIARARARSGAGGSGGSRSGVSSATLARARARAGAGSGETTAQVWQREFEGVRPSDEGRPGFTPIRVALDALSTPAYVIGDVSRGDLRGYVKTVSTLGQGGKQETLSDTLRARGQLPGGWLGTSLGLALDIGTDPTTYVTLGAGGLARTAGRNAVRRVGSEALDEAIESGQRVTLASRARASALDQKAIADAGRSVRIGFQVPFSRARDVTLIESKRLQRALDAVTGRISSSRPGEAVRGVVSPSRGIDQRVNQVRQDVRRLAAVESRSVSLAAKMLDRQIRKAEKAAGLKRGEGAALIARHLDNPTRHALPDSLTDLAEQSRALLARFDEAEMAAGIERGSVENYVPHLGASRRDSQRIREIRGAPTANVLDDPFFTKPREAANLDEFEAIGRAQGFTPEMNIARLIERRGWASIKAQEKKAIDDAIFEVYGAKPPPAAVPSLAKAEARVAKREAALARAIEEGDAARAATAQRKLDDAARKLDKAEVRRGAAELLNAKQAARPGRQVGPEEYERLRREWLEVATATKYHGGDLLPPEIQRALARVHDEISAQVSDPEGLAGALRFINRTTGQWKALALLSPGYHMRNLWSDSLQSYWAGARNPHSFVQANRILAFRSRVEHGKRGRDATITIGRGKKRKTWTYEQVVERARAHGVIDTGQVRADILSSDASAIRGRLPAAPGRGRAVELSGRIGDRRENIMRLGTWLELLKRGDDPATAAARVREYLYDYGEVGRFVQASRSFWLPFITYQSKALPNVIRMAAERPGRLASLDKTTQALTAQAGSPDLSDLPTGQRSSFAVPLSSGIRSRLGLPADQPILVTPERLFSYGTLNVLDARPGAFRRNVLAGLLGPIPRASTEIATQQNLYFGSDFAKRARAPRVIQELAERDVPIPGYGPKTDFFTGQEGVGYDPTLDVILRLFPQYGQQASLTGPSDTARIGWLRYLLGFPASPYDQARRQAQVERFGND